MSATTRELTRLGASLWLDGLDRRQLLTGEFSRLIRDDDITGVTTNPSTLRSAIQAAGDAYTTELADARARGLGPAGALRELSITDVRYACDQLRGIFESTIGLDGYASIEVDPRLADDADATVAEARSLAQAVNRPNVLVKIPATHNGLAAIRSCVAEGLHVNVTLIFGLRRYAQVIDAFMDGLEQRHAAGGDIRRITSVASFFVSRVDAEVNNRDLEPETAAALRGRVAIANARLAYRLFLQSLTLPRWASLATVGARPQRPLWASTSTKDRSLADDYYVTELAVRDVVLTVPPVTLRALERGRNAGFRWTGDEVDARRVLGALAAGGVDLDELVLTLERAGVRSFVGAWHDAIDAVERSWRETAIDDQASPARAAQGPVRHQRLG